MSEEETQHLADPSQTSDAGAVKQHYNRSGVSTRVVAYLERSGTGDKCGSRAGYFTHRRNNERPCDACRQANADMARAFRLAGDQELSVIKIADRIETEADAYRFLENLRWHGEPVCPHCGSIAQHYFLTPRNGRSRTTSRGRQSQRRLWKCKDCRQPFSVLTGTIMHGTHISVRTWVMVFFELCANKNGLAAREVERKYSLSPKSAWFMLHRIREAMMREPPCGLLAGTIQADEAWIGGKPSNKHQQGKPVVNHPLIKGMLGALPAVGEEFPDDDRELWLEAARINFRLIYGRSTKNRTEVRDDVQPPTASAQPNP